MAIKTIAVNADVKERFDHWQWLSKSKSQSEALAKLLDHIEEVSCDV